MDDALDYGLGHEDTVFGGDAGWDGLEDDMLIDSDDAEDWADIADHTRFAL